MLRLLLTALLVIPLHSFRAIPAQRFQVESKDFVDYLTTLTPLFILISTIFRHNEICKTDDDCPLIMRCCEIGHDNYCCTPNNFVKLTYAFQNQEIQHHEVQDHKNQDKPEDKD